jgi:hypothetical protein
VIESMEETGSLYTPGSGALAGMLAEHETPCNRRLTHLLTIGMYLTGMHLTGVYFTGVNLTGVHFTSVYAGLILVNGGRGEPTVSPTRPTWARRQRSTFSW